MLTTELIRTAVIEYEYDPPVNNNAVDTKG